VTVSLGMLFMKMSGCRGWYKNIMPLAILSQEGTRFLQGSVMTHLRCGGIFIDDL